MKSYQTLSKSVLFENPWWRYGRDAVEFPSGRRGQYHYVSTNGSAMVLPVTASGRLILVRQYRYTGKRDSLEFPSGGVKNGADHESTAREELREETGYAAAGLETAGEFNPCNGLLDEICRVYIARDLRYVGARPDETESFELVRLAPEDIDALAADGTIWDGRTLAAWALAGRRLRQGLAAHPDCGTPKTSP